MRTEFLCISVLRVASGPRVKLASCKSALNPPCPVTDLRLRLKQMQFCRKASGPARLSFCYLKQGMQIIYMKINAISADNDLIDDVETKLYIKFSTGNKEHIADRK